MKRYSMTQVFMGLGCAMVATHDGNYVLHSEAQAEIDALKAQNAELLAAHWEFADLVERVLPVVDYGGWCAISEELKAAIAKARGDL